MKRFLMMLACLLAVFAFAAAETESHTAGDFTYVVKEDGTAEITDCTAVGMVLEIPAQLDGYTVTSVATNALGFNPINALNGMKSHYPHSVMIFPDTVTYIAGGNLNGYLAMVALPDGVEINQSTGPATGGLQFIPVFCMPEDATFVNPILVDVSVWPRTSEPLNLLLSGDFCYQIHPDGTAELLAMDRALMLTDDPLHVVIPESVEGHPVTAIAPNAFHTMRNLASVEIPGSVKKIGESAFNFCRMLEGVNLPEGLEEIGPSAFAYAEALTSICLPEGITTIGEGMFRGCRALHTVKMGANVREIGDGAFEACGQLVQIDLPEGLETIGSYAFAHCGSLGGIVIPDSVQHIGYFAFGGCRALAYVRLSNGLTELSNNCFESCEALAAIRIPEGVTTIGAAAFYECRALRVVEVPQSVTVIGAEAFNGCEVLTRFDFPEGLTQIANGAFRGCALREVVLPGSVGELGRQAFAGCTALKQIKLPESLTLIGQECFYGCMALEEIRIPPLVTELGAGVFEKCSALHTVTIMDGVTRIRGYTYYRDAAHAFDGCNALRQARVVSGTCAEKWAQSLGLAITYIDGVYPVEDGWRYRVLEDGTACILGYVGKVRDLEIPERLGGCPFTSICDYAFFGADLDAAVIPGSVKRIGRSAFEGSALVMLEMAEGVKDIGDYAFSRCASLTMADIPDSVVHIGTGAFERTALRKVTINGNGSTEIGEGAFTSCSARSVTIGEGVESIGENAFKGCDNLTQVEILSGVIGENAFAGCDALESVTITAESVGEDAFADCKSLKSAVIHAGGVGQTAFSTCKNLQSVTVEAGVIGKHAFERCQKLSVVTLGEGVTEIGDRPFRSLKLPELYVPASVENFGLEWYTGVTTLVVSEGSAAHANLVENGVANVTVIPAE